MISLSDSLKIYVFLEHQRSVSVPEVVRTYSLNTGFSSDGEGWMAHCVLVKGPKVGVPKDKVRLGP